MPNTRFGFNLIQTYVQRRFFRQTFFCAFLPLGGGGTRIARRIASPNLIACSKPVGLAADIFEMHFAMPKINPLGFKQRKSGCWPPKRRFARKQRS